MIQKKKLVTILQQKLQIYKNPSIKIQMIAQQPLTKPSKPRCQPKSALQISSQKNLSSIQYIKQINLNEKQLELSDQQKQDQMNKIRDQYIQQKLNRKKDMLKIKREQYGTSSSQDDDVGAEKSDSDGEAVDSNLHYNYHRGVKQGEGNADEECSFLDKPQKVYQQKGKENWVEQTLSLKESTLLIKQTALQLSLMHKIKSIAQISQKKLLKLKLSYSSQQLMLSISKQPTIHRKCLLPHHYLIFASLISRKLQLMGLKPNSLQKSIPGVPESIVKGAAIYGKIWKKSQIFGRWDERLVVINHIGLYSYKTFHQQHSMFIDATTVKELWTRFQIVDQNLLVLKILHSNNTKTEFGIPLTDFINEKNWLFQFYNLSVQNAK